MSCTGSFKISNSNRWLWLINNSKSMQDLLYQLICQLCNKVMHHNKIQILLQMQPPLPKRRLCIEVSGHEILWRCTRISESKVFMHLSIQSIQISHPRVIMNSCNRLRIRKNSPAQSGLILTSNVGIWIGLSVSPKINMTCIWDLTLIPTGMAIGSTLKWALIRSMLM